MAFSESTTNYYQFEDGMKIINLTPHDIHLHCISGDVLTIPRSGVIARVDTIPGNILDPIQCDGYVILVQGQMQFTKVVNLPEWDFDEDAIYIVSLLVAQHCGARDDVFSPDSGSGAVRNEAGQMVGTTQLIRSY